MRNALESAEFVQRFRLSAKAFTRRRQLPCSLLVVLLLNLRKGSTETELQGFFSAFRDEPLADTPTRSAFCKARRHLSPLVFVALNRMVLESFTRGFAPRRWQGLRLLAVDGTTLRLPPDNPAVIKMFGEVADGPPLARVSTLYAVGHGLVLDAQMAATGVSERELAIDHLEATEPGDLLLYDRGYPAFWFMALHRAKGRDFCMRLSRTQFAGAGPFWNSQQASQIVTLTPSAAQRRQCRDQEVSQEPITVRLVRVRLRGGVTEVLATSLLDEQRYPSALFASLYHQRWSTEENYKRGKRWAELESFSGLSPLALRQDFHAKILALNLAAMIRAVADQVAQRHFAHRRQSQQVRWTNTLSALKNQLVRLLLHSGPAVEELWYRLLGTLAGAVDGIRPDRQFPRDHPGRRKIGPHMRYKAIA